MVTRVDGRDAVYVDASFADGIAGLAMAGALGEATTTMLCAGSNEAEHRALAWAMQAAYREGRRDLCFLSDCTAVVKHWPVGKPTWNWRVEYVPRALNAVADRLSRRARLSHR
jgi:ribonuclease HI